MAFAPRKRAARLVVIALVGAGIGTFFACRTHDNSSSETLDANSSGTGVPATLSPFLTEAGVWTQVASDPYPPPLPHNSVSLAQFASSQINPSPDRLSARAATTIGVSDNIVQPFDKLVHANGVCVRGRWIIDQDSPFTGGFAKGTDAPFIGRISVAFDAILRGDYRAFGFAGKVFRQGNDLENPTNYETANFFTIDDLAGTTIPNFTDTVFSNEPPLTKTNLVKQGPAIVAIGAATAIAFKLADSHPGMRQLYEISELGLADHRQAVTPQWMHLKATTPMINGRPDFRMELRPDNFRGPLTFEISVSSQSQAAVRPIGRIVLSEMVASSSCDHRFHVHHPPFREDLNFGQ
jgi:hypothetical protein